MIKQVNLDAVVTDMMIASCKNRRKKMGMVNDTALTNSLSSLSSSECLEDPSVALQAAIMDFCAACLILAPSSMDREQLLHVSLSTTFDVSDPAQAGDLPIEQQITIVKSQAALISILTTTVNKSRFSEICESNLSGIAMIFSSIIALEGICQDSHKHHMGKIVRSSCKILSRIFAKNVVDQTKSLASFGKFIYPLVKLVASYGLDTIEETTAITVISQRIFASSSSSIVAKMNSNLSQSEEKSTLSVHLCKVLLMKLGSNINVTYLHALASVFLVTEASDKSALSQEFLPLVSRNLEEINSLDLLEGFLACLNNFCSGSNTLKDEISTNTSIPYQLHQLQVTFVANDKILSLYLRFLVVFPHPLSFVVFN